MSAGRTNALCFPGLAFVVHQNEQVPPLANALQHRSILLRAGFFLDHHTGTDLQRVLLRGVHPRDAVLTSHIVRHGGRPPASHRKFQRLTVNLESKGVPEP